jgi:hypothetical protein
MFIEVMKYNPGGQSALPGLASQGESAQSIASNNTNNVFNSFTGSQFFGTDVKQSIILPMPNAIASVNRTGWGESRISSLAGAGLKLSGDLLDVVTGRKTEKELGDTVKEELTGVRGAVDLLRTDFKSRAQVAIVNAAAGTSIQVSDVRGRQSGQIVNQNVELLFNSVSIRPFGFNWDFTPRNDKEAEAVLQMIKTFKKSAAPKKTVGQNGFLSAPDIFRLTYKKGIDNQRYLNKFKMCALTSVGVDYTGSGIHATYESGSPVHYKLNLSFTELEPIYAEDYGDNFDDAGF